MEKSTVNVNLTLTFDHSKETTGEAFGFDQEKIYSFETALKKEIVTGIEEKIRVSEIAEWIAKNMPAEYLASILEREVKNLLYIL